jgi:rod shape-determining protein MreB
MIIDIGGGTSEIAVISLGGIVSSASVRIGRNKLDAAIQEHVRRKYGLAIGERTAEDIKIKIGSALYLEDKLDMEVKGRDMISGLPRIVIVTSDDVTDAIQHELQGIIEAIKEVLRGTPPELSADVMQKGMVLSGGSSQLRNLDRLFAEATGVPAMVADNPQMCVARGTGIALENLDAYKRSIFSS